MEEVWKDIEGYEGRYQISNYGRLLSLNYHNTGVPNIIKPKTHRHGYVFYILYKDGTRKAFMAHRLVALAFISNPNNYPIINHKDENKLNNYFENLEWCTCSYNVKYSLALHELEPKHICKRRYSKRKKRKAAPYKYFRKLVQFDSNMTEIRTYENLAKCVRETKYSNWSILQCCKGERATAYGYKWRFVD